MKRFARASALLFADVVEHANDVIVVTDANQGHIVYVDAAYTTTPPRRLAEIECAQKSRRALAGRL